MDTEYLSRRISLWHSHLTVDNATRAHMNTARNMDMDSSISAMGEYMTEALRITCERLHTDQAFAWFYHHRFHGEGTLQTASGDKLWGTWCRGKISGRGNIEFANGDARPVSYFG